MRDRGDLSLLKCCRWEKYGCPSHFAGLPVFLRRFSSSSAPSFLSLVVIAMATDMFSRRAPATLINATDSGRATHIRRVRGHCLNSL